MALVAPPALLCSITHAELACICLQCEFSDVGVKTWSKKETIAWGACTPLPTLETFNKKIRVPTASAMEIAGLL